MKKFNEYGFWVFRRIIARVLAVILVGLFLFAFLTGKMCLVWLLFLVIDSFLLVLIVPVDDFTSAYRYDFFYSICYSAWLYFFKRGLTRMP